MATELFPTTPDTEPPPKPSTPFVKNLVGKNAFLLGIVIAVLISMAAYIIVAPSQEQRIVTASPIVLPTPTKPVPTNTPLPLTPTPTAIPLPSKTPTPTIPPGTAWKTYANTKQGYRIKYSPDWTAQDLGELEPKIPSYIAFNEKSASASSRFITISVTTRTYEEQLALGASSSAITVAGIKGTKQFFQDSDGNTSTVVILPRTNDLIVLRAKTPYLTIFNLMLSTLYVAK